MAYLVNNLFSVITSKKSVKLNLKLGRNKAKHPHSRVLELAIELYWSFFDIALSRYENILHFQLQILGLNFFISYHGLSNYITQQDKTWVYKLSIHHWFIWWVLGCPQHSWSSSDGWRNSNFDILTFILGKEKYDKKDKETKSHILKLPEGEYALNMTFITCIAWRSRVPRFIWERRNRRVNLIVTPEIPYPGKNNPVSGYSEVSFPASSTEEVVDKVYNDIRKKRRGIIDYYNKEDCKIVDNFYYTIHGLKINLGRVPVRKFKDGWEPIGITSNRVGAETFRNLSNTKEKFTPEELGFINKYMGISNSIDFIRSPSQEDLQKEMKLFFRNKLFNEY